MGVMLRRDRTYSITRPWVGTYVGNVSVSRTIYETTVKPRNYAAHWFFR